MQITSITPQKKRKDRVNIFLDGAFSFGLDLDSVISNKLKVGLGLSPDDVSRLTNDGTQALLYSKALSLISRRPRTEKEIRDYLVKNEAGEAVVESIIEKLKDCKFLDDIEFAKWFIDQRSAFRPKGQRALRMELKQKGIKDDVLNTVFENNTESELENAQLAAEKKLRVLSRYSKEEQKEKLIRFLQYRGFGWNVTRSAVDGLVPERVYR